MALCETVLLFEDVEFGSEMTDDTPRENGVSNDDRSCYMFYPYTPVRKV